MSKPTREYIYGINPVFEVVRAGKRKIYMAYLNRDTLNHPRLKKLSEFLEKKSIPVEWTDKGRLSDLSKHKEHQGAVLKTSPYPYMHSDMLLEQDTLLLLDNIEDPHNVGAILRSAEIFGFHNVLLSLKGVPEIYPSVVKVSAGASEFLQIAKDQNANGYVKKCLNSGHRIVALDGNGSTTIQEISTENPNKLLLVVGGEDKSVGQFILNQADFVVRIPQTGKINSLNASVAASITMFALSRRSQQ